jgi:putative transposase
MTLGGRRVPVSRPRIRTVDDECELPVATYDYLADRDPLTVERTKTALGALMSRRLEDMRLAVMMLDGIEIADTLARSLLADLVDRGLDPEQAILFVIDGGKALRRAIKDVFGEQAVAHRCHRHKKRNVTGPLPERDRPQILAKIPGAWSMTQADLAQERLERLASQLERTWPAAAASLREGMDDTLTLMRLVITGQLAKTLCSTNPCGSMLEIVRHTQRNVKRWQDGDMRKRWTAAGMLVAEQQFRRIIGYRDLAKLVIAIERHPARVKLATPTNVTHTQVTEAVAV